MFVQLVEQYNDKSRKEEMRLAETKMMGRGEWARQTMR
jgi:hypothetical protein